MSFLSRIFGSKQSVKTFKPKPKDSWEGCSDSLYIHSYRAELEKLAQELQDNATVRIYTRFNPRWKAAEILADGFAVFARVNIHGSEGLPYRAEIGLNPFLDLGPLQERFRALFWNLTITFYRIQEP